LEPEIPPPALSFATVLEMPPLAGRQFRDHQHALMVGNHHFQQDQLRPLGCGSFPRLEGRALSLNASGHDGEHHHQRARTLHH